MDPERTVETSLDFLTPERAGRADALAAVMAAKGVHVEFPHERMAHQLPCQVVGEFEALRAGGGECFRQRLLPDHGHIEAILDVIFPAGRSPREQRRRRASA